nr:unnamed protein product [Callosobruchus chinensis]
MLDAVQRRAIRLIGDPALTCQLQPLSHRLADGDLLLFYRYSNGFCSYELTSIILLLTPRRSFFIDQKPRPHLCPQGVQGLKWTAW